MFFRRMLFQVLVERELFDKRTAAERLMKLSRRKLNFGAGLFERDSRCLVLKRPVIESDQRIRVRADARARLARARSSVAQRYGYAVVVLSRLNVCRYRRR